MTINFKARRNQANIDDVLTIRCAADMISNGDEHFGCLAVMRASKHLFGDKYDGHIDSVLAGLKRHITTKTYPTLWAKHVVSQIDEDADLSSIRPETLIEQHFDTFYVNLFNFVPEDERQYSSVEEYRWMALHDYADELVTKIPDPRKPIMNTVFAFKIEELPMHIRIIECAIARLDDDNLKYSCNAIRSATLQHQVECGATNESIDLDNIPLVNWYTQYVISVLHKDAWDKFIADAETIREYEQYLNKMQINGKVGRDIQSHAFDRFFDATFQRNARRARKDALTEFKAMLVSFRDELSSSDLVQEQ